MGVTSVGRMRPLATRAVPLLTDTRAAGRIRLLPLWAGYTLAVLLPMIVASVVWWVDNPGYRLGTAFIAAVTIVAALAGTRPALLAAGVSFVAFWYTVTPPIGSFSLDWPEGPVALATFAACTGVVVLVVHQRDRATKRTVEFQRRYRRLADVGLIGVIFWNLDGPITGANDAFLDMVGYTRGDLREGRIDWKAMTPAEWVASDEEKVRELVADGYHDPYEKEYIRKDGSACGRAGRGPRSWRGRTRTASASSSTSPSGPSCSASVKPFSPPSGPPDAMPRPPPGGSRSSPPPRPD